MVPPADAQALAGAIESLVKDPGRREALRGASLETAAGYSQDAVLDRFCRYLVELAIR
jgi:glycosyltransferase involved in cell wall biosynthesis